MRGSEVFLCVLDLLCREAVTRVTVQRRRMKIILGSFITHGRICLSVDLKLVVVQPTLRRC